MRFNRTLASVVGMVVIAGGSFGYMYKLGLPVGSLEKVHTANMAVPDTNGLAVGSRVLLRGVAIGHISKITSAVDKITVEWNYDERYHVPANSSFRIDNLSALGESYLAVTPADDKGPYLANRATVDPAKVVVPTTIKELSARLTRMLEQVDPDRIGDIFRELNIAMPDDVTVLGNLSHAGDLLAETFIKQSDNFTKLLNTVQPLLQDSSWLPGDMSGVSRDARPLGRNISNMFNGLQFATVFAPLPEGLADGVGPFVQEVQKFLDNNAADLHTLGVNLLPSVKAGAASMATVDVGQLLDNALASSSGDSVAIHLHTSGR